jgi:UDP-N-acetylmuramate dehydrogenase
LNIQERVSLADKNWFCTGGYARFFAEPCTIQEVYETCVWARAQGLPIFLLGHGANILISDDGFDGLVIRSGLDHVRVVREEKNAVTHITVGSGISMDTLIEWCLAQNLLGLEEFSGIPGTVGGSVYINLHYYQFFLDHFLYDAQLMDLRTGECINVDKEWFGFGYNQSRLLQKEYMLLEVTFVVRKSAEHEVIFARGRRVEIIRHRNARYPTKNTCGSFFRNFHEHEVTITSNGKKMIHVAYYLDKLGFKGTLQVGGATVSHQHANMIVTNLQATTTHVAELARVMQHGVQEAFGIIPQPECQLVGFKTYPLL